MNCKVSISIGNAKMGTIPSVSLPAVKSCVTGCLCAKKCYAKRMENRYKTVRNAYQRNLDIFKNNQESYFLQIQVSASLTRFFRWHVSGDIINDSYLLGIVNICNSTPNTKHLCFTKNYSVVNDYINKYGMLPDNLVLIFSEWDGMKMDNPHNLPVAHVILKGSENVNNYPICGGNCSNCVSCNIGCWTLKSNEHIAFYEH